ncbi:MAG: hypothetical protein ACE37I_09985 [Rubinisphaera brasiliensis]|uniref:Uncharacterized protein n=2 Tax=Rubinisphaera TaxID=1649490 RepID=F0SM56_RUBBR|nr:hypothetical protein [Rubinisphaera brasiliensis]ADY61011.1 hypothetical protein Plabr_3414 [Rubinisphaera brasiliensis DSM 5305]
MWPFGGGKDWNVVGILFEKNDTYMINANRVKGKTAESVKRRVKLHDRTLLWVVYDQKGSILESGQGNGCHHAQAKTLKELEKVLHTNNSIRDILRMLESGKTDKAASKLIWSGYPRKKAPE